MSFDITFMLFIIIILLTGIIFALFAHPKPKRSKGKN